MQPSSKKVYQLLTLKNLSKNSKKSIRIDVFNFPINLTYFYSLSFDYKFLK